MGLFGIFGNRKKKVKELLDKGALVLDVRSAQEFQSGHVDGAVNVPLGNISKKIKKIQKLNKPVITCCATGMRSSTAARELRQHNIEVINGGSWTSVNTLVA